MAGYHLSEEFVSIVARASDGRFDRRLRNLK